MAMTDLVKMQLLFSRIKNFVPTSDWEIDPDLTDEEGDPNATHVLVFGCPNGNGSYLEAEFDYRGNILQAKIIGPTGYPCKCEHCDPCCPTCGSRIKP